jgi:hypothetical protein
LIGLSKLDIPDEQKKAAIRFLAIASEKQASFLLLDFRAASILAKGSDPALDKYDFPWRCRHAAQGIFP